MSLDYFTYIERTLDSFRSIFIQNDKLLLLPRQGAIETGPEADRNGLIRGENEALVAGDILCEEHLGNISFRKLVRFLSGELLFEFQLFT